jgi:hypothetical protein
MPVEIRVRVGIRDWATALALAVEVTSNLLVFTTEEGYMGRSKSKLGDKLIKVASVTAGSNSSRGHAIVPSAPDAVEVDCRQEEGLAILLPLQDLPRNLAYSKHWTGRADRGLGHCS